MTVLIIEPGITENEWTTGFTNDLRGIWGYMTLRQN
jgi:hypothetical protein